MAERHIVVFNEGKHAISIHKEPTEWGKTIQELHDQADAGYVVFGIYSHNKFNNVFHSTDIERYNRTGYWAEIFCDTVIGREKELGETPPYEGAVPVLYISSSGLEHELRTKTWFSSKAGLVLPIYDDLRGYKFFHDKTLSPAVGIVPFDRRMEVERAFEELGLPTEEIFGFYPANDYRKQIYYVGRYFGPGVRDDGRFDVNACWLPSGFGFGRVGSRMRYENENLYEKLMGIIK